MEMERVSLANIAHGAAVEVFDRELGMVLENIADRNTKTKTARKIVLEVTIVPTEDRSVGSVGLKCSSKLAAANPVELAIDLVQEGRNQVAYQRKARQGELPLDNIKPMGARNAQ